MIHSLYGLKDLEEASGAYKNINDVMNHQRDLVEIDTKLEPLGVIKG
ncbi:MAG: RtcB family protein [Spirochaetales bacterium]|nr:RtcB family protein [Spirochaetales bacterium]